ncbi:MAG: acyltransferase [Methylotenera sp.]|nr:acyltransferase [Oligoflexia bacterium]
MCAEFRPRFGGNTEPVRRLKWDFPAQDVIIGNDVWIGANVSILKGAQIGDGCVIATGSVVTAGIYPAGSLLGGIPAKVIRSLLEKAEVLT